MLTELFANLSILTGMDPVPLQNLASGIASGIASPVLLFLGRKAMGGCKREPRPVSEVCKMILDRMRNLDAWVRDDKIGHIFDGVVHICDHKGPKGLMQFIKVDDADVTPHLFKGEAATIYAAARDLIAGMKAEELEAQRKAALEALAEVEDDQDDEEDGDALEATHVGCDCNACRGPAPAMPAYLMKR